MAADEKPWRINLALQGGGAHGAFTWGALDRLLEEPQIEIQWISGTSAGAVNAAAVAAGLAVSGPSGARMTLKRVWQAIERSGVPEFVKLNPFFSSMTRVAGLTNFASTMSPYDINPLGFDPLRKLLDETIDFAAIRGNARVELLIAATDVATGRARLFRRNGLKVEHVLASACLPSLHHAVEIEGRIYWDGGYSANPDLITLALESPCQDTLLIELNPRIDPERPRSASDIAARVAAITFNQPLLRDIQMIVAAKTADYGLFSGRGKSDVSRLRRHRFHLIEAGRYTATLGQDSKVSPDSQVLAFLFEAGRREADTWIGTHAPSVGRRSSVDLTLFTSDPRTEAPTAAESGAIKSPGSVAPFQRPQGGRTRD